MYIGTQIRLQYGSEMISYVRRQATGVYGTKELRLLPYHRCVVRLMQEFEDIAFRHILRGQNNFADALATLASLVHIPKSKTTPQIEITV